MNRSLKYIAVHYHVILRAKHLKSSERRHMRINYNDQSEVLVRYSAYRYQYRISQLGHLPLPIVV